MDKYESALETVRKSYSYKLALKSILIITAGAAIAACVIYFSLHGGPGASYGESYAIISGLRGQLLRKATVIYLVTSALTVLGVAVITLLYSHRVAGPLHRLGIMAHRVASGDLSDRVKLRANDVVHPVADDLNNAVAAYRDLLLKLQEKIGELKEGAAPVRDPASAGEEVRRSLEEISEKTAEIKEMLSNIKF